MFCSKCGTELLDEAVICTKCGCLTNNQSPKPIINQKSSKQGGLKTAAKVFMIISCVLMGLYLLPLLWVLPMTIVYCNKVNNKEPIGVGFKICILLFVNMIAGILLLCDSDD